MKICKSKYKKRKHFLILHVTATALIPETMGSAQTAAVVLCACVCLCVLYVSTFIVKLFGLKCALEICLHLNYFDIQYCALSHACVQYFGRRIQCSQYPCFYRLFMNNKGSYLYFSVHYSSCCGLYACMSLLSC